MSPVGRRRPAIEPGDEPLALDAGAGGASAPAVPSGFGDGFDEGYAVDDLDDDVVYVADEHGAAHRGWAVAAFMLLFVVGALGLGWFWLQGQINPSGSEVAGQEVTVDVPAGSSLSAIARILEEEGVVTNGSVFSFYAQYKDVGSNIRPGHYDKLYKRQSMDAILARLEKGPAAPRYEEITIPEGKWLTETADLVKAKFPAMNDVEMVQAMQSVRSKYQPATVPVDGFLFPATYRVEEKDLANEAKLLGQMTAKFDAVADEVGLNDVSGLAGMSGSTELSPYEVLKVAALVEAEAKVDEDRPRIARVIYNRLAKGMKLQIDATVLAAQRQRKERVLNIDLQFDSPYNTYRYAGLTPTPIDSPGQASLDAALHPSDEPGSDGWIFYVLSDKEGRHTFTANDRDHQKAVDKARADGLL